MTKESLWYRFLRKSSLVFPLFYNFLFDPKIILEQKKKQTIYIKIPVPYWSIAKQWGDYYLAQELKQELKKLGYKVIIHCHSQWDNNHKVNSTVIVFRGLYSYNTRKKDFNIMWNISHPKDIIIDEYKTYHHVFISSLFLVDKLRPILKQKVSLLDQCTNLDKFFPIDSVANKKYDLLFVGNTRGVFRKIIKDLLPSNYKIGIIGSGWENYIDKKYIIKKFAPNSELNKLYNSTNILLNDHWDDMKDYGFVSNRIFDGMGSGCQIISDKPKGNIDRFNGKNVYFYEGEKELKTLISSILNKKIHRNSFQRNEINTYKKCAFEISTIINQKTL